MKDDDTMTAAARATLALERELEFAIDGLREDGGIELVAASAKELLAGVTEPDLSAQHLRELARLLDRMGEVPNWREMSHYAKLKEIARYCDNDVSAKLIEIADELRIHSMADAEMEAYQDGNISRETLVERLEELAEGDTGILEWLRAHDRYGAAWHDDSVETF